MGIRYGGQLNRRGTWLSNFRADFGGFGLGSDLTWNVRVGLGYNFSDTIGVKFGYHWMDIDYDHEGFPVRRTATGAGDRAVLHVVDRH